MELADIIQIIMLAIMLPIGAAALVTALAWGLMVLG